MYDHINISVGGRGMSVLYKLHRKGLNTVCIPRSIENDIAAKMVSLVQG
jgi:6-phosphofructokinase 1